MTADTPDRPLFRARALESIDSIDGLDEVMTIVPARSWIALAAIGVFLLALIGWGVFGTMPIVVRGAGVVSASGGLRSAIAPATGFIVSGPLAIGTTVAPGDVIARVRTAMLETIPLRAEIYGFVVDLKHRNNEAVVRGDPIATIQPQGTHLTIDGFVQYGVRQSIGPGTPAEVKPLDETATLASPMRGTIVAAAPYPASAERISSVLGNDRVASELRGTSLREVTIDVRGGTLPAGAPYSIAVVTSEVSPLRYLFPNAR